MPYKVKNKNLLVILPKANTTPHLSKIKAIYELSKLQNSN